MADVQTSDSCCFENMTDENYSIFTTTTLKRGFYDPDQPENHTKEREKGKDVSGGVKKKTTALNCFNIQSINQLIVYLPT